MPKKLYDIDTMGQFHKTFSSRINAAIGLLQYVLTYVTAIGTSIMPKKAL
jgi:hypothetical protein